MSTQIFVLPIRKKNTDMTMPNSLGLCHICKSCAPFCTYFCHENLSSAIITFKVHCLLQQGHN